MAKKYYNIFGECPTPEFELISWKLFESGALSIEEKDIINQKQTFSACFDHQPNSDTLKSIQLCNWVCEEIPDKNWDLHWKMQQEPILVTKNLTVIPPWIEKTAEPKEVVLKLEAKMAFGTGSHESTQLIAKLIEASVPQDCESILDIGTGTGILAMYAQKLHPNALVVSTEIDPLTSPCLAENYPLNGLGKPKSILAGLEAFNDRARFQSVFANMIRSEIWPLRKEMLRLLEPKGRLLISGQLAIEKKPIFQWFKDVGLKVCDEFEDGEWWAVSGERS